MKSELLEAFLTNPGSLLVRVPFAGSKSVDGSMRFLSITSNGMVTTEDLSNRASIVRLEKNVEKDYLKINGMKIDELIQLGQPTFMGAVTKIIRHYHENGMPETAENEHSFTEWAQRLDWIVQNIFHLPPLLDGRKQAQMRVQNPALAFVRVLAIQLEKVGRLELELSAQELADLCESGGVEIPGLDKKGQGNYTEKQEAQRLGQLFKQAFQEMDEIVVEPYRVIRLERLAHKDSGKNFWKKSYKFERMDGVAVVPWELAYEI